MPSLCNDMQQDRVSAGNDTHHQVLHASSTHQIRKNSRTLYVSPVLATEPCELETATRQPCFEGTEHILRHNHLDIQKLCVDLRV